MSECKKNQSTDRLRSWIDLGTRPGASHFSIVHAGQLSDDTNNFIKSLDPASVQCLREVTADVLQNVTTSESMIQMIIDLLVIAQHIDAVEALPILQEKIEKCELDLIEDEKERERLFLTILTGVSILSTRGDQAAETCLREMRESSCCKLQWIPLIDQTLSLVRSKGLIS